MVTQFCLLMALISAEGAPAAAPDLAPGVKILASGEPIDVEVGHAAPYFADVDGDGTKDLLVGQFGGGKLRIYRNEGSNSEPKFTSYKFFQAGGQDASVPFG